MKTLVMAAAVLLVPLASVSGAAHQGEPAETLSDVLRATVATHEALDIAAEASEQARLRKERFFMSLTPEVLFQTFGRRADPLPQGGESPVVRRAETSYGYSLTLSQPLFAGGRAIAAWRGAGEVESLTRLEGDLTERELVAAAAEAYYAVLAAAEAVRIGEQAVVRARRHLELAERRLELGEGVITDRLRAEVNLAEVESDLIGFRNSLANATDGLNRLCGCSLGADPAAIDPQPPFDGRVEALIEEALARRLEREQDRHRIQAAEEDVKEKKGRFLPNVFLTGGYFGNGSEYFDQDSGWEAAVNLTFPIYERASRFYLLRESRSALRQAELLDAGRARDISLEVSRLYNAARASKAAIATFSKQQELAAENSRLAEKRFSVGLADSIETVDTQTALLSAQVNLTAETLHYEIAKLRLQKALGRDLFPEILPPAKPTASESAR